MKNIVKALRWILFLPLGFVASIIAGMIYSILPTLFGGDTWYSLMVLGAIYSGVFVGVASAISPQMESKSKMTTTDWMILVTVSLLGVLSIVGGVLRSEELVYSITGVTMIILPFMVFKPFKKDGEASALPFYKC